jgi:16S rRNA (cytosine1402-N4)-methyltransferase
LQASIPYQHRPVLLAESIALLEPKPGDLVVDGTLGGGGHAAALLERIGPAGRLVGFDVDDEALLEAGRRLGSPGDSRVTLVRASFRELGRVLSDLRIARIDRLLLDLGVSSRHLDAPERGFRFSEGSAEMTPLDMRMDRRNSVTAADLLRTASAPELERIFREYGELAGAARLARALVAKRRTAPIRSAADLLAVVRQARVGGGRRHHPATLVFQALRIAVNDELAALREGLSAGVEALREGGRLAVIAYHSLEDRTVKEQLRQEARGCVCPPRIPVCVCGRRPRLHLLTRRPVTPSEEEIRLNPRSRSAHLRGAARLAEVA